ncbi:MAG: transposase, partial [Candidatus Micrarchaeota archaeon]|nr:transposase [Candidatus Micrarchaeota archaeon]
NCTEPFFGYKLHVGVDATTDNPLAFFIRPANKHDKKMFGTVFSHIKENFRLRSKSKYLADSALDSSDVRMELRYDDVIPLVATNGRGHRPSEIPNDPEYANRWSVERFFSRLKEVFGLSKNRFVGMKKVMMHVYSCIIAYLIAYL